MAEEDRNAPARAGRAKPSSTGPVALTAKQRARTALHGTTALGEAEVLGLIKSAAAGVKGEARAS